MTPLFNSIYDPMLAHVANGLTPLLTPVEDQGIDRLFYGLVRLRDDLALHEDGDIRVGTLIEALEEVRENARQKGYDPK